MTCACKHVSAKHSTRIKYRPKKAPPRSASSGRHSTMAAHFAARQHQAVNLAALITHFGQCGPRRNFDIVGVGAHGQNPARRTHDRNHNLVG